MIKNVQVKCDYCSNTYYGSAPKECVSIWVTCKNCGWSTHKTLKGDK